MRLIKNFNQFNLIQEVDATGTYLDAKNRKQKSTPPKTSITRLKFGKIFAQAPKTADKSWGLKFVENGSKYGGTLYKVVFPDDFLKYFAPMIKRPDGGEFNLSNMAPKSGSKISDFSAFNKNLNDVSKSRDVVSGGEIQPGEKIRWEDLQDINIVSVKNISNRTHFLPGVPEQFHGIGLGYVVYEEFIKFLGFASSDNTASPDAQKVWSVIITDPDFYGMIIKKETPSYGNVFVVHKDCKNPDVEKEIKDWMKKEINNLDYRGVVIDDKIFTKYPDLVEYKDKWTFETRNKLNNIHLSLKEIFNNADSKQCEELIKLASDNFFEINDYTESEEIKKVLKDGLVDLSANESKFDFYKVVFLKLLSSEILNLNRFKKLLSDTMDSVKSSVRDNLIKYLFDNLKNSEELKQIIDFVKEPKLRSQILSYKLDETTNVNFRFMYFYENQDDDLDDFIDWINKQEFNQDEDFTIIIKLLFVAKDKQKVIDKLDKKIFERLLSILENYAYRNDVLMCVDNLSDLQYSDSFDVMKKDLTIENSYLFYKSLIKYLKGEELVKQVNKFLKSKKVRSQEDKDYDRILRDENSDRQKFSKKDYEYN